MGNVANNWMVVYTLFCTMFNCNVVTIVITSVSVVAMHCMG